MLPKIPHQVFIAILMRAIEVSKDILYETIIGVM